MLSITGVGCSDLNFDATAICFDVNHSLIIMGTIDGDIALLDWPVVSDTRPRIFPFHNGKVDNETVFSSTG